MMHGKIIMGVQIVEKVVKGRLYIFKMFFQVVAKIRRVMWTDKSVLSDRGQRANRSMTRSVSKT